jgi:peptide/nickel transport system substrate-binding protein
MVSVKKSRVYLIVLIAVTLGAMFCTAAMAKDTLIVADQYDAHTMDPASNSMPTARACYSIYDTLVFIRDGGEVVPGLAESWEFLSGTAYKFSLRKGVKFHNGDEIVERHAKMTQERGKSARKIDPP